MKDPIRILILTADVGFGHRKAANALAAALSELYREGVVVAVENPLDDERTPSVLHDSQADYDRMVREMPDYYRLRYQLSDSSVPNTIMESMVTVMLFNIIRDLIHSHKPDLVITTHPMYPAPLSAVNAINERNTPFFTVVTDLALVHRLWFNPAAELCLVGSELARQDALDNDIPDDRVRITGIPVHPDLVREPRPQASLRLGLGWQPDLTTALIVGSKRVKNLDKVLHVINHSALPLQKVIVTGGDDELYASLQKVDWHGVTHLYNYVEDMPAMLQASDLLLSKAGGLIVTEALACGLPMLLVDITPGQEEGNADYVISHGAADQAENPVEALEVLFHWLDNDQQLLHERAHMARKLGRPRAAFEIAQLAYSVAQHGPLPVPENHLTLMPRLIEMLNQFGIIGKNSPAGDKPQVA